MLAINNERRLRNCASGSRKRSFLHSARIGHIVLLPVHTVIAGNKHSNILIDVLLAEFADFVLRNSQCVARRYKDLNNPVFLVSSPCPPVASFLSDDLIESGARTEGWENEAGFADF